MARDFRITFDIHLIDENDDTSITEINESSYSNWI